MKTLILGGVRSGKSRLAEKLAIDCRQPVTYVATAVADDEEMIERISAHRQRRPRDWQSVEEPLRLADVLRNWKGSGGCVIVDCITLWLTNLLHDPSPEVLERERRALLEVLPGLTEEVIIVTNEINMGVVPLGELTRRYCDLAGTLHQDLARVCDRVVLTVAGLPQVLKGHALSFDQGPGTQSSLN